MSKKKVKGTTNIKRLNLKSIVIERKNSIISRKPRSKKGSESCRSINKGFPCVYVLCVVDVRVSLTQTCLGHPMSKDDTNFVDMKSSPPMNELNARACMVCKMHDMPIENGAFRPQQTLATPP